MSNLNKKIFLFIMLVGMTLGLVGCGEASNATRIFFSQDEYVVRLQSEMKLEPTIIKSSAVGDVKLVYSSSDESVVKYENGTIIPVGIGEAVITAAWKDHEIIFDKATIQVVKAALPSIEFIYEEVMGEGETQKISISLFQNYTNATYTVESLNPEVATIDEENRVVAVSEGTAEFKIVLADEEEMLEYSIVIEVVKTVYSVTYNLEGGENSENNPATYSTISGLVLEDATRAGYNFKGWKLNGQVVTSIPKGTLGDLELTATWEAKELTIVYDLQGGEHEEGYPTTFTVESEDVALKGATKANHVFKGWKLDGQVVTSIPKGTTDNVSLVAEWAAKSSVTFVLRGGAFAQSVVVPTEYVEGEGLATLPEPTRENYTFSGWYVGETKYESITTEQTGEVTLTANWTRNAGVVLTLEVGAESEYKTIAEALVDACNGDTIKLAAGEYEGANITVDGVTIEGPNANIDPNTETRVAEAIIKTDLRVSASSVTINGVVIQTSRIVANPTVSVSDLTVSYIIVREYNSPGPSNAPIVLLPNNNNITYRNFVLKNSLFEKAPARTMILYGSRVENISVLNNRFLGTSTNVTNQNWNDGIKLNVSTAADGSTTPTFDVRGKVEIIGNYFQDYLQYVIWLSKYGTGTYDILNNTFKDCCRYASNGSVTMVTYVQTAGEKAVVKVQYNVSENSQKFARLQYAGATAENWEAHVNYNKIYNNGQVECITNNTTSDLSLINATNNYYDKTPTSSFFVGVSAWEPYYANEDDVPVYGQPLTFSIQYVLNEGVLTDGYVTEYTENIGVATLPTPTRSGYDFLGWYDAETEGNLVTSIPATSTGPVVLYARWQESVSRAQLETEADRLAAAVAHTTSSVALAVSDINGVTTTWEYKTDEDQTVYDIAKGERLKEMLNVCKRTLVLTLTCGSLTTTKEVIVNFGILEEGQTAYFYRGTPLGMSKDETGEPTTGYIGWNHNNNRYTVTVGNKVLFVTGQNVVSANSLEALKALPAAVSASCMSLVHYTGESATISYADLPARCKNAVSATIVVRNGVAVFVGQTGDITLQSGDYIMSAQYLDRLAISDTNQNPLVNTGNTDAVSVDSVITVKQW